MRITDLGKDCAVQLSLDGCGEKTLDEYDRIWRQFVHYLCETRKLSDDLRHFTPDVVQAWSRKLHEDGLKASTIRQKLAALSSLGRHGLRMRTSRGRPLLSENPCKAFTWPKRGRPRQDFLLPDELRRFMAVPRRWPAEAIARALLIDTGLRVSELCRANVEDFVKLRDGWVLYVTVKGHGTEEQVPCPVSADVAEQTADYLRSRPKPITRRGEPEPLLANTLHERYGRLILGDAMRRIGRAAKITRITVSPHKLRRTSNLIARYGGIDSLTRSRLLNHLDPSTIRAYDALVPGELAQARELARTVGLPAYLEGSAEIVRAVPESRQVSEITD